MHHRIGFIRIDAVFFDGLLHSRRIHLAFLAQRIERRQHHEMTIHFKEMAQFLLQSSLIITPCRVSRDDLVGQGWIEVFLKQSGQSELKPPILTVLNGVNKRSSILAHVIEQLKDEALGKVSGHTAGSRVKALEILMKFYGMIDSNTKLEVSMKDSWFETLDFIEKEDHLN